jgi:hypothetical protein
MIFFHLTLLLFWLLTASTVAAFSALQKVRVQVCQNKDCCSRWRGQAASLSETLQDLLLPDSTVEFESSGCLSLCGKGPNVRLTIGSEEIYLEGMEDATKAAAFVEEAAPDTLEVPSKLLAAVTVLEKAEKGR